MYYSFSNKQDVGPCQELNPAKWWWGRKGGVEQPDEDRTVEQTDTAGVS